MRMMSEGHRALGRSLLAIGGRFGWGVADQALSSITNFAIGFIAARSLPSPEFGAFAIVFAVYLLALGTVRAVASEPFVIRHSSVSSDAWGKGVAAATGAAVAIGAVSGAACIVAGIIAGESLGIGLIVLGITMPGLLLQDTWRFAFFAARRGSSSFANDLVWGIALAVGIAVLLLTETTSVGWLVLTWGAAGTVAGIWGTVQSSVVPRPGQALDWVRTQRYLATRFLGEFSVTTGVAQLSTFGLGVIAGLTEVASLRAGQLLLGPLHVLFHGVGIAAVPEGVRALRASGHGLLRICRRMSLVLGSAALLVGVLVWLLPDDVGTRILRGNWEGARSVVIPLTVMMAFSGMVIGASVGLRSLAAARLSLRARLFLAPISLTGGLGGAALGGAVGAAWGIAVAMAAGAAIWWGHFAVGLRNHGQGARPAPEAPVPLEDMHEDVRD